MSENVLRSAVNGQVLLKIVEQGELVSPGQPVITIIDLSDQWITLNLREDRLAGLRIGDTLPATHSGGGCGGAPVQGLLHLAARRLRHLAGHPRGGRIRRAHFRGARAADPAARGAPAGDERAGALAHESAPMSALTAVAAAGAPAPPPTPRALVSAGPHPGSDDPVARGRVRLRGGARPARGHARSRPERHLAHRHPLARGDPQRPTGRPRRGPGSRAVGHTRAGGVRRDGGPASLRARPPPGPFAPPQFPLQRGVPHGRRKSVGRRFPGRVNGGRAAYGAERPGAFADPAGLAVAVQPRCELPAGAGLRLDRRVAPARDRLATIYAVGRELADGTATGVARRGAGLDRRGVARKAGTVHGGSLRAGGGAARAVTRLVRHSGARAGLAAGHRDGRVRARHPGFRPSDHRADRESENEPETRAR